MISPGTAQLVSDPAMRHAIFLAAIYLTVSLAGVLAFVYDARFRRLGLGVAVVSGAMLLATTFTQQPILVPVAIIGLGFTALAGRSIQRERAGR